MLDSHFQNNSVITPRLFTERGFAPVITSPGGLYGPLHVERYVHTLPELASPPLRDAIVVLLMQPGRCIARWGRSWVVNAHQAGETVILPVGFHARWEWPDPMDVLHLRLASGWNTWADGSAPELGPELGLTLRSSDPQLERLGGLLLREVYAGCPSGRIFGEGIAAALAAHLLTYYAVHSVKPRKHAKALGQSDLRRVLDLIGDRLADDLSLEELAAVCCLSPYHFSRLFKQSTGQSPHQYVIRQRVERAKELLRSGRLTVGQVTQAVGFADQSQMHRHFKRLTSLTPGQFSAGQFSAK